MITLTPKQQEIVRIIRQQRLAKGYSPTLQEIGDILGVSKVTVHEHMLALEEKGAIVRDRYRARCLELSPDLEFPDEERHTRIPLVGTIAAGSPIEAVEATEHLDLESVFAPRRGGKPRFALKVKGESMIEDQINDGDYVVCEQRDTAREGDIVVALVRENEATLKRFYRESRGQVRLQPANKTMKPMVYPSNEVQIQGVCVGVIRQF